MARPPGVEVTGPSWLCPRCSYVNAIEAEKCRACRYPDKPHPGWTKKKE